MTNSTCPAEVIQVKSPPLIHNGVVTIQAHQVGWLLCGIFAIISTLASFWLINKHLMYYTNPGCQRYIVRLLFMVPIYSLVTLAAYIFYNHASPFLILRDGYEGVVLYAFFYLMLQYLSPSGVEQRNVFRRKACFDHQNRWKWLFPLGWVKYRPNNGLYFLQLMKWGVLQYCVIRPSGAIMSVIMEAAGLYCEDSWSPAWAHIWIVTIVSISVTIAMYCLLQLYVIISPDIAPHKPLLQLFSVKAIVFLTFWQSAMLGGLATFGVVKNGKYMTADEINVGIAALLQNFEMVLFAFLHIKAFSYRPYRPKPLPPTPVSLSKPGPYSTSLKPKTDKTSRLAALRHAFSFVETWRELRDGAIYLWKTTRGREAEPHSRLYHFEAVMGMERPVVQMTGPKPLANRDSIWRREEGVNPRKKGSNKHDRRVSWDPALEPFYPLATIDEELEAAPPQSLLRHHLVKGREPDVVPPSLIRLKSPEQMDGRFPAFGHDQSLSPQVENDFATHALGRHPQPPELVMPAPLSPARFPFFHYTDERITRH